MNIFKPSYFELTPESLDKLLQEIRKEKAKVTAKYGGFTSNQNSPVEDEEDTCDCDLCETYRYIKSLEELHKKPDSEDISALGESLSQMFSDRDEDDNDEDVLGESKLKDLYPKYHKDVSGLDTIDIYRIHELFDINDPSGRIHHASKKLLLAGSRNGGKAKFQDIREARDTLDSWLADNS